MNEVIARDENEFELFTKMDEERYERENRAERIKTIKDKKPQKANLSDDKINYRLIQDWEVPDWVCQVIEEEVKEDPTTTVLGKRTRKEVNYKEQLSETQWAKMIDAGINPDEEMEKRNKRRLAREQDKGSSKSSKEQDEEKVQGISEINKELQRAGESEAPQDDLIVSEEGSQDAEQSGEKDDDFIVGKSSKKKSAKRQKTS